MARADPASCVLSKHDVWVCKQTCRSLAEYDAVEIQLLDGWFESTDTNIHQNLRDRDLESLLYSVVAIPAEIPAGPNVSESSATYGVTSAP